MKTGSFWSWSLGVGLVAVPLIGGCLRTVPPPAPPVAATEPIITETDPDIVLSNLPGAPGAQSLQPTNVEEAVVRPLPAEFALPPNVQPTKPLADLIRLAQAGADEGVLLTFVTNSPSTFNPRADDLVYLKDIGLPDSVVSALLQRDEKLKAAALATTSTPAPAVAAGPGAPAPVPYAAAPTPVAGPAVAPEPPPPLPPPDYGPENAPAAPAEVIYPDFYDTLAPYGSWVDVDGYGYCWQPAVVGPNPYWQPYFDGGGWVYTDCGWYWRSDYSWGWAPFHYGRWFHHHQWGWCWQPDRVWGPAWVCWRQSDTHCGWAPLPPGVRFTATTGLTDTHHQVTQLSAPHFRFVEWRYFQDHNLAQHGVGREQANRVYNQTTLSTRIVASHGTVSNEGLAPERVSAATHTPVTRVALRDVQSATVASRADRPEANGRTLSVYRPQVASVPVSSVPMSGRAPATKPLATSTPSVRPTTSLTTHSPVSGSGSGTTASVTPPPSFTSQRAINPTRGATALTGQRPARSEPAQATAGPEPVQPPPAASVQSSPIPAYRAASRYYPSPGAISANRGSDNAWNRSPAAKVATPEVPRYNTPDSFRPRVQVPDTAAPQAPRFSAPAAERPAREVAPVARPARVEAPEPRPSRAEARPSPAESRVSRPAPSAPSPAPAPSRAASDRPDRADKSDSGARGGRR